MRVYKITTRHSQLRDVDTPHKIFLYMGWAEEFRDANNDSTRRVFILPKSWAGKHLKLTVHFNGDVNGGGNDIYFKGTISAGSDNEYWDNHTDDSGNSLITEAHSTAYITKIISHTFTGYTIDTNDQICLDFERLGNDALDTYTGSVYVMALIIEAVD